MIDTVAEKRKQLVDFLLEFAVLADQFQDPDLIGRMFNPRYMCADSEQQLTELAAQFNRPIYFDSTGDLVVDLIGSAHDATPYRLSAFVLKSTLAKEKLDAPAEAVDPAPIEPAPHVHAGDETDVEF